MIRQIDFCKHPEQANKKHHVMYSMFYDRDVPQQWKVCICDLCHVCIHRIAKRRNDITVRDYHYQPVDNKQYEGYHRIDDYRWINGSIRQDLQPDERSVWADFLALAGLSREGRRGYIERSQGIPYPKTVLLTLLNITEELFDRTVSKCVKEGRLQVLPDGTMFIVNWLKYNDVSSYETRRRQKSIANGQSRQNRKSLENVVEGLTRKINELNTRLHTTRYQVTKDGKVLDAQTGEISDKLPADTNDTIP